MYATNRKGDIMTSNEQLASVGRNIQEKATLIWNVANTLFGAFKPHEYGLVILPCPMAGSQSGSTTACCQPIKRYWIPVRR